jgi:hypothetical protein
VFWFEENGGWFKRLPATILTATNSVLRDALGVPHPNYRQSPA